MCACVHMYVFMVKQTFLQSDTSSYELRTTKFSHDDYLLNLIGQGFSRIEHNTGREIELKKSYKSYTTSEDALTGIGETERLPKSQVISEYLE